MLSIFWSFCLVWSVRSLEVSNGSSCADTCNGPTLTFSEDLSCVDDSYSSTSSGELMKSCLECESKSNYVDTNEDAPQDNDQYWMLFNMKYTLQYCLTQSTDGTPNFSECKSKCEGLFPALTPSWFANPKPAQYDYCTVQDHAFTSYVDDCASCLLSRSGSVVLGNFLAHMNSGCDSRADAHSGDTIPIQRQLFDTNIVPVASTSTSGPASASLIPETMVSDSPSATPTGSTQDTSPSDSTATTDSSSSPQSTSEPAGIPSESAATTDSSSSPQSTSEPTVTPGTASTSSNGLSSGAAAGIGVSCGLGALALGIGALWYLRRRRNTVRVPRSMLGQSPHHENKPVWGSGYSKQLPSPPAETRGHERYEMGQNQRYEMGEEEAMKAGATTYSSELDGRSVPRQ